MLLTDGAMSDVSDQAGERIASESGNCFRRLFGKNSAGERGCGD